RESATRDRGTTMSARKSSASRAQKSPGRCKCDGPLRLVRARPVHLSRYSREPYGISLRNEPAGSGVWAFLMEIESADVLPRSSAFSSKATIQPRRVAGDFSDRGFVRSIRHNAVAYRRRDFVSSLHHVAREPGDPFLGNSY